MSARPGVATSMPAAPSTPVHAEREPGPYRARTVHGWICTLADSLRRAHEAQRLFEHYQQLDERHLARLGLSRDAAREAVLRVLHGDP